MRPFLTAVLLSASLTMNAAAQSAAPEKPLFDPARSTLYSQTELWRGFDPSTARPGWDADVYAQYIRVGKFYPPRDFARAMSLHDDGISAALRDYVLAKTRQRKLLIGIMGNAREDIRCTAAYRQTVQLGYELARNGYIVVTGGGPGEMEAANLGAYLSSQNPAAVDEAIAILRAHAVKSADPSVCHYSDHIAYTQAAFDVLKRFPSGAENLGVPTWFYGHEPPNNFATLTAKYFSNALREDILLALGTGGVVYTEGRAGLRQEIFQKATQNNFASFCYVTPMIFLGTRELSEHGLYALTYDFAEPAAPGVGSYRGSMKATDSVPDVIAFLKANPPRRVDDPDGACRNMP
jgi:hypothetical protein